MRWFVVLMLALATMVAVAWADDDQSYVIDTRVLPADKGYLLEDGQVRVVDSPLVPQSNPVLVLWLRPELYRGPVLVSLHPGSTYTFPLQQSGANGETKTYGVVQIRDLRTADFPDTPRMLPDGWLSLLAGGKHFTFDNVELVLNAPGYTEFRAAVYPPGGGSSVLEDVLAGEDQEKLKSADPCSAEAWISGSL